MEPLLDAGLNNALLAALLAILVAVVGSFARRPALVHSLWLLVLLKLVTPPLLSLPVAWPLAERAPFSTSGTTAPATATSPVDVPALALEESNLGDVAIGLEPGPPPEEPAVVAAAPVLEPAPVSDPRGVAAASSSSVWSIGSVLSRPVVRAVVALAWLGGSAVWLVVAAMRIGRFRRLLQHAEPAPEELVEKVEQLAGGMGLREAPGVWLLPGCVSPLLWAIGVRARLYLPSELWYTLDASQREALLLHELAHLRRRDHWVRSLELVVTCLYWWNPVVWLARRALREAEEQCCDAWVVWALPRSAQAYATALLQTVDFLSGARPAVPMAASGIGHLSCLKRRLTMIMQASTPRGLSRAGRLAVFGLAAILLPLVPTRAQQAPLDPKDESKPAPRTVEDVLRLDDSFVFALPQELRLALSADDDRRDDRDDDDDRDDPQPRRSRSDRREADRGDDAGDRPRAARVRVRELKEEIKESKDEAKDRNNDRDNQSPEKREQIEKAKAEVKEATEQLHKAVQRLAELEGGKGAKGVGVMIRMVGPDGHVMSSSVGDLPGNVNVDHVFRFGPHGQMMMPQIPSRLGQPAIPGAPHAPMAIPPQPRAGGAGRSESRTIEVRGSTSQATERRIDDLEKKLDRVLEELRSMKDDRGRR